MRTYEIMHKELCVAQIDLSGVCIIFHPAFMPYHLYLEAEDTVDARVNNLMNFYYWCSTRVLTMDRQFAKALLNSAGLAQAVTDRDRAKVALSYRCLSITDVYWVREKGDSVTFAQINLYENHLDQTFVDIALRGKQYSVQNEYLARDLSTNGCFPKAWRRTDEGFCLLKDGGNDAVARELLASRICRCFDVDQVLYEPDSFDGDPVTSSVNMTSLDRSIASMDALQIWLLNQETDPKAFILQLDPKNYYMMNIIDYLIGNPDRHWGNWGVLVDTATNRPLRLHDLMDFNQAFMAYDTLDGANCQTCFGQTLTQKEAALEAVRAVGLNQLREVDPDVFASMPQARDGFNQRLALLRDA